MKTKGNTTMSIMKPVTRNQFSQVVGFGLKALRAVDSDIECACNFATEFGAAALFHKVGGDIVLAIIVNNALVDMYDHVRGGVGGKYWAKRGEGGYSYWSRIEIYDHAMGLANLAKEAAK